MFFLSQKSELVLFPISRCHFHLILSHEIFQLNFLYDLLSAIPKYKAASRIHTFQFVQLLYSLHGEYRVDRNKKHIKSKKTVQLLDDRLTFPVSCSMTNENEHKNNLIGYIFNNFSAKMVSPFRPRCIQIQAHDMLG